MLSFYQPVGLDGAGVDYRIPLPGAEIEDGVLTANARNPGMAIEYSRDGAKWKRYGQPVRVDGPVVLRTRAPDGRTSRISPVDLPDWQAGTDYRAGALVRHQGEVYSARRAHSASRGGTPDTARRLWTPIR